MNAPELAGRLAQAAGGHVRAILLYGSHLLNARPDRHSAYDFVVVVPDYRSFHRALADAGELHRPVWLMTALAGVLPPNTLAFAPDDGRDAIAKCLVLSQEHFERALGPEPPDHFLVGRMVQKTATLWTADDAARAWVDERLAGARRRVLDWVAPYLEGSFDAADLGRRLLEVSYAGELRPEAKNRSGRIFDAQAEHFREVLPAALEAGVASGLLERDAAPGSDPEDPPPAQRRYRLARPTPSAERRARARYFRRSKVRATTRWFKHMLTFANWLPYIVRKVERHSGRTIQLTWLERTVPIVFLWPRAIWVLATRPRREIGS